MDEYAFYYGNFACWHMPALGGSGLQHRLCGGRGIAKLSPGVCNRSRPARALNSAEGEIVVARRIGRRELGPNLGPIGIELIGDDCRESRRDALPFVEMFDDHSHTIRQGNGAAQLDPPKFRDREPGSAMSNGIERRNESLEFKLEMLLKGP
jgi:hypothetical protein